MTDLNGVDKECQWNNDLGSEDDERLYLTDCGNNFLFGNGGPKENDFKYCCFCGKPIAGMGE